MRFRDLLAHRRSTARPRPGGDVCEFTDVGAGDEGLVAGPRQDHAADRIVVAGVFKRCFEIFPGGVAQGVKHLGTIERHISDRAPFFSYKMLVKVVSTMVVVMGMSPLCGIARAPAAAHT